jgi:hypothetical protein
LNIKKKIFTYKLHAFDGTTITLTSQESSAAMLLLLIGNVVNDQRGFGVSGMLFMHNFLKTVEALYIKLTVVIT